MHPDPNPTGSVSRLIDCARNGLPASADEAARRLWERYRPRLLNLARCRLDPRVRALHDEEDVVQSIGRSFFHRLRRGGFELAGHDDLWALLAQLTRRKACKAAEHHFAEMRDVRRTQPISPPDGGGSRSEAPLEAPEPEAPGRTADEAAALLEALEERLRGLKEPELKRIALMKLEDYTNGQIADALPCSERTVERKLNLIRKRWEAAVEHPA
jgi:RNA polymerase sigma factor (sigma-70 family)